MKKLITILSVLFLFSCNDNDVTISKEEYNKHIKEVIENTLNIASGKAVLSYKDDNGFCFVAKKDSILNTFEETYLKYKI